MSLTLLIVVVAVIVIIVAAMVTAIVVVRLRKAVELEDEIGLDETEAVVLAHGLLGFESIGVGWARQRYFRGIRRGLESAGVPVFAASVAPLGSVPERAAELAAFIDALTHDQITVLAHSMGGLDARYAISLLGAHHKVRVLITIGTPHRGSALADLASKGPAKSVRRVARLLGYPSDAIDWLTTESLERFNREVIDHPNVAYYSVVGRSQVNELWRNPLLLGSHLFLRRSGGDNDGLVTVESQRWGETLEEIDANHFAQIGWSLRYRATALYLRLIRRVAKAPVAPETRRENEEAERAS